MPPIDRTRIDHVSAPMNCGVKRTFQTSNASASGTVSAIEAENWISVPALRSKLGHLRFWYSVPTVIASSAPTAKAMLDGGIAMTAILSRTTSSTPRKPSAKPTHWRAVTRSPIAGAANAVMTGCSPTISAVSPAGMPSAIAIQTPPR